MLDVISNHRSIRKYKADPIPENVLNDIYESISKASNTGNMQIYSVVATTDEDLRAQLCEKAHFNQPMVKQAPLVLTFCADLNRFNKWCEQRKAEPGYDNFLTFYTASVDAIIAAQNACLAAEEHGLGICYLGTTNYNADAIIDILKLPKQVVPVTTVVVGYPDEAPELTDRLPLRSIIHKDTYQDFSEADIDQVYEERDNSEFTKKLIEENATETLAQIFTEKRYSKANNLHFSKALLSVLDKQGFMNND